jgi:Avidin family
MLTPNIDGSWVNELGSEMELAVHGSDINGTYKTGVGSVEAKKDLLLYGTLHYPLISFFVDYSSADSLCAWVGRFEESNPDGKITLAADLVEQDQHFQDFVVAHELLHFTGSKARALVQGIDDSICTELAGIRCHPQPRTVCNTSTTRSGRTIADQSKSVG